MYPTAVAMESEDKAIAVIAAFRNVGMLRSSSLGLSLKSVMLPLLSPKIESQPFQPFKYLINKKIN